MKKEIHKYVGFSESYAKCKKVIQIAYSAYRRAMGSNLSLMNFFEYLTGKFKLNNKDKYNFAILEFEI